jgi:hypothetical protein
MFFGNNYISTANADIITDPAAQAAAAKYSKAYILALSGDATFPSVLTAVNKLLAPNSPVNVTLLPKQVGACCCKLGWLLACSCISCNTARVPGVYCTPLHVMLLLCYRVLRRLTSAVLCC